MREFEDELTQQEREAYASLPRELRTPPNLEQRTVDALKQAGLIRKSPRSWHLSRFALVFGTAMVLLVAGAVGVLWNSGGTVPLEPDFILVMRAGPPELQAQSEAEALERVKEYGAWARKDRTEGKLVGGEELADEARFLKVENGRTTVSETSRTEEPMIAGYFLFTARDYEQAVRVAQDCPHLKYGGTVEVREIQRRRQ